MQRNMITRRYQVVRTLGEGGMGEVFLVEDLWESNRQVALKKLRREMLSEITRESFVQEFTALKQLRHPYLASVYDFGYTPQGDPFFTSEYCDGADLISASAKMGFGERLERAVEICRALAYIHARGYMHADLKPENILILSGTRPNEANIKVLDFGLARHVNEKARPGLSGTLAYLAPEVIKGRPFDPRADLYALGIVLYQLFTRQLPFENIDPQLLVDMQLSVMPAPPTEKDGTLPVAMDSILLRLLDKDPDNRFQASDELISAFNQSLGYQFEIETHATARDYVRSSRFVGRSAERERLHQALTQVLKEKSGRLVLVGGESGVGKTRLLDELKIQAQLEGVRTFSGAAYEKISEPLQCFPDILRPMVLSTSQASPQQQAVLERYEPTLAQFLPQLFHARAQPRTQTSSSAEKEFLLESLAMFVLEACAQHPTLILIQDIHWADALSLELIERITRNILSQRLILGVSYRSDEVRGSALEAVLPSLSKQEATDLITLKPMTPSEVNELVTSMLGIDQAPTPLMQRIIQDTRGNPFFIQEVLWTWMEEGIIYPRLREWSGDAGVLDLLSIPQTMADAFLRRIGKLSKAQQDLLQVLALFNKPVSLAALASVLTATPESIEQPLNGLVESAVLSRTDSPEAPQYFFSHVQMKYSIESGVAPDQARKVHRTIGEYYEAETASSNLDQSEILAYHFAASEEKRKAQFYSIRTGDKLRKLFLHEEAITAYRTAEFYTESVDKRLLEIREKIAFCYFQLGELDLAERIYKSLIEESGKLLAPARAAKLQLRLGMIAEYRGNYDDAIEINRAGLSLIESLPEPKTKAQLLARIGFEYQRLSNYRVALDYVLQALALVEHVENYFALAEIYNEKFIIHYSLGEYSNALEAGHRAIAVYTKFGWASGIAGVTANIGIIYEDHLCEYRKAFDYQRRALQLREKIFDRRGIEQSYLNLASIHCKIGEYSIALEYLDRAARLNESMPERHLEMLIANHRGQNWTYLGQLEEARAALEKSLEIAETSHNQQVKVSTLNRISEWHQKLGDWAEARTTSFAALHLARSTENKSEELCASVELARIEMEGCRWTEADQHLDRAINLASLLDHNEWRLRVILLQATKAFYLNQLDECRSILAQAKALVERFESPHIRAQYHLLQGKVSIAPEIQFQYSAVDHLYQALRAAESTEDFDLITSIQHSLGRWYQDQGDVQTAQKFFRQAVSIITTVASRLPKSLKKKYLEKEGRAIILESIQTPAAPVPSEAADITMGAEKLTPSPLNRQNYFVALFQISKIVNSILNLNDLLERVMDLALEAIHVERGLILLVNEDSGELEVKVARNISKATMNDATAISQTVLREVLQGGKPLISVNALDDQRLRERRSIVDYGIGMVLCIPLTVKEKIVGAVYIDNPIATLPFNEEDVNFLMSFTNLFAIAIENARLYEKLNQENIYLRQEVHGRYAYENILGRSPKMMELFRRLDSVVTSSANVLIFGESGTGKELIARAIHYNGSRKEKRFVAIDCGAIPENLIESELFGYKRGAFTGAVLDKKGLFEEADGGTVFLDEITNTSRGLQAKLLRVIQEREIRRVGDSQDRKVDVRLIAATNRDLKQMVQNGEFREDLFYRLNVLHLSIPPLRERKEDIPLLVNHILKQLAQQNPGMARTISQEALRLLMEYTFPGNIRELENLVESAFYMAQGDEIQRKDFPPEVIHLSGGMEIHETKGARVPTEISTSQSASQTSASSHGKQDERIQALEFFRRMKETRETFWNVVKEPFMKREISKELVREVIKIGLRESRGRYKDLLKPFHLEESEYTVFMNFLRKHGCQVDYKPYRQESPPTTQ